MGETNGEAKDKVIRPAASLLIIRDGTDGLEVLTLKRSATMRFLPGFLNFPGGSLDSDDWTFSAPLMRGEINAQSHPDDVYYAVGGLRECAEEVGLLCAVAPVNGDEESRTLMAEEQGRLLSNELKYAELLVAKRVMVDLSALRLVGRWVTPAYMPARFDTRFFLYRVHSQLSTVRMMSSEIEWAAWCRPLDLLQRIESGEEQAVPPTIAMLNGLTRQRSAAACFEALTVPGPPAE
jgi:8-oxo-dGTP pyrophosphatase MutT (NUDIX family)